MIDSPSSDLVRLGVDLGGQRIVGYCDLQGQDLNQRELGFVIAERDLWGVGIGGAAASLMLDYGFNSLHLTTIDAEAWDANDRSIRILQRLGMREIGFGEAGTYRGMPSHFRVFEITRSEWVESLANPGRSQ